MKYNVYVFRHGQTTYNKKGVFTGWQNPKLTPFGISQAKKIALLLKNKKIDLAIHTPSIRTKQTLNQVLKFHPECKKILTDKRMIERSYGDLEGTTHESFVKKIGKKEYDLLRHGDAIEDLSDEYRKKVEKFLGEEEYEIIHRGYNIPPPNGESFADVEVRVASFIKDLKKLIKKEKVNVAISASGNSIRLFRKIMEKRPKEQVIRWKIPWDDYYHYRVEA
jgi:2,3-bisphosphoglycerate-dependent phosphoglycerate mutase